MTPDSDLDRLLATALHGGRAVDDCPDADRLSAFAERSVSRAESTTVERHVSNCARCAAILGALLASDSALSPSSPVPGAKVWHAWRWLVPAVTFVLVAGLWFSSSRPRPDAGTVEQPLVMASRDAEVKAPPVFDGRQSAAQRREPPVTGRQSAGEAKPGTSRSEASTPRTVPPAERADKDRVDTFAPSLPSGIADRQASQSVPVPAPQFEANEAARKQENEAGLRQAEAPPAAVAPPPAPTFRASGNDVAPADAAKSTATEEKAAAALPARPTQEAVVVPPEASAAASRPPAPPRCRSGRTGGLGR